LQAEFDERWARKVAAREAAAARAARRERTEDAFMERLKRLRTDDFDGRLAELSRRTAKPRLELGLLLHRMHEWRGFIELGLPSFVAYAKQRVSQGARWAGDARRLARALYAEPGLPLVAGALERGVITWSMAWLVAGHLKKFARLASTVDDAGLEAEQRAVLELLRGTTVRKGKVVLAERLEGLRPPVTEEEAATEVPATPEDDEVDYARLERTVPLHEAWLIEDVRLLFNALVHDDDADDGFFIDSLVAEATASIGMRTEEDGETFRRLQAEAAARRAALALYGSKQARERDRREAIAERRFEGLLRGEQAVANGPSAPMHQSAPPIQPTQPIIWRELPESARALDAEIQRLCEQLELAELDLCTTWVEFDRRGGWRRYGFASRSQYARERLGLSRQAECELRARGQTFRVFPELYDAVRARRIGLSAARLLGDVVTCDTVPSWIDRAEQRTVVHLKQEIEAVRMSVRRGVDGNLWPPSKEVLEEAADLERRVLAGEAWTPMHDALAERDVDVELKVERKVEREDAGHEVDGNAASGEDPAAEIVRMSARERDAMLEAPSTTYRFVLPFEVAFEFELAERVYEAMEPDTPQRPRPSFLAYACLVLYAAHKDSAEASVRQKWGDIYLRDRFRCQNPVCGSRRTVTPHHMKFQSHGGGDEPENIETLCHVCHLEMVHERRSLVVEPPASSPRWIIGGREAPLLEVVGREVVRRAA